jgi:hypothetical protein
MRNGFLLVELLIALFLWSIIIFYVANFTVSIYKNLSKLQSEYIQLSDSYDACSNIVEEISRAPKMLNNWKFYSVKEMKWQNKNNENVSFYIYRKNLIKHIVSPGSKSRRLIILENINDIKFEYIIQNNLMKGIRFIINVLEGNNIECFACCKGG